MYALTLLSYSGEISKFKIVNQKLKIAKSNHVFISTLQGDIT